MSDVRDAKARVSERFLGQYGVHAVGLHPTRAATISVYRGLDEDGNVEELIERLSQEALPYHVELVHEAVPIAQSDFLTASPTPISISNLGEKKQIEKADESQTDSKSVPPSDG